MNGSPYPRSRKNSNYLGINTAIFPMEYKPLSSMLKLDVSAAEFVPTTKISLNIEAKEFNPLENSEKSDARPVDKNLRAEPSSIIGESTQDIIKITEIINDPVTEKKIEEEEKKIEEEEKKIEKEEKKIELEVKIENEEKKIEEEEKKSEVEEKKIEEEEKKIDTKCSKISVESFKIAAVSGDIHEIDHCDEYFSVSTNKKYTYTVQEILEKYPVFSKFDEFFKLEKKLQSMTVRKYNISRAPRGGSPRKKQSPQKRDIIRIEEFRPAELESWRKKKSIEEAKISEAAKRTTLKLTTPIEEQEKIKRKIKITLNKLSPNNIEKLQTELLAYGKESKISLQLLIESIFEKAWSEVKYTPMYAQLCRFLKTEFEGFMYPDESPSKKINYFRYDLLIVIENTFHNTEVNEIKAKDPESLAALIKKKTIGNVRFIGELIKMKMISPKIIQQCVENLLSLQNADPLNINEDKTEGACILISTAGSCFENAKIVDDTNKIFQFLNQILQQNDKISSKLKFKIMV